MANNQKLEITGLDFDVVKDNLKTYMKNQNQFLDYDFEGAGINALLDVLAYNTHYLGFHANMLANEMFIDSSQLRSSVVGHAKTLGYEPRSARAPRAEVNITLNDTALGTATMNAGTAFTSTINNVEYRFVTTAAHTATQTGTGLPFTSIPIFEGTYVTTRYTVDTSNLNQRFLLTDNKSDTTTLTVKVQNSSTDSTTVTYTKAEDITQLTGSSSVYFLQEVEDGLFEVYFGDGVVSKAVLDGNIVILQYVVTNVAEANGAFLFSNTGAINTVTDITVTTVAAASGGAEAESIQSIKLSAPLDYASQGRCVTANDYKVYVQKFYPQATAIQVFGGENGSFDSSLGVVSTPEYGKVFISVRNNLGTNLTTEEKTGLVASLAPYTVASITPVVVDPDFIYLFLTTSFKFNSLITTKTKDTLVTEVTDALTSFNSTELVKFDAVFRHSQLLRTIGDVDASISSITVLPRLVKYFTPSLNEAKSYNLYFNNELYNPHSGHNVDGGGILSSTGFKVSGESNEQFFDDDGKGNLRIYYLTGGTRNYTNSTAGTVDYKTGSVNISSINITSISDVDGSAVTKIRINVLPNANDIVALRNQILEIDVSNSTVTGAVDSVNVGDAGGAAVYSAASSTIDTAGTATSVATESSTTTSTTSSSSTSTSTSTSSGSSSSGY